MSKFIKDKFELNKKLIGMKAYNLGILEQAGLNIPKWFAVSSECKKSDSLELMQETEKYLKENFDKKDMFAVRSSGISEDGENYSYAGQYETFLNVKQNSILENIQNCWQSVNRKNVRSYEEHIENKENEEKIEIDTDTYCNIGVIVQKMIMPDCSGVLFTANPNGILNEMVVVVGEGQGINVVEDKVPVCTYYYNINDRIYYFEKQEGGIELTLAQFEEIIEVGKKIYKIFDNHTDIEWCIKDNELYILQARPITTLDTKDVVVLDNSNIVESYPNITLPLTQSFIKEAYYQVFKGAFTRLVRNKKVIQNNDKYLKEMLGIANGRVYYKISNWYTFIKILPFNKKIIPVWQEMMGVSDKEVTTNKQKVGFFTHLFVALNTGYLLSTVSKKMKKLNKFFLDIPKEFNQKFHLKINNNELLEIYDDLARKLSKDWDITLANDMSTFIFTGLVKSKFKKMGVKNYVITTNKYISGLAGINSMNPVKELVKISKFVAEEDLLLEKLKKMKTDEDFEKYVSNENVNTKESDFIQQLKSYVKEFGDRSIEELKLESKTFRTSPILLIKQILQYAENKEKLDIIEKSFLEEIEENMNEKLNIKKSFLLNFYIKRATDGIKNREISRLNRSRVYGMIRKIFLKIGDNLYQENRLDNKEDIFYLYYNEIQDSLKDTRIDLKNIVKERKVQYENYTKIPGYSRLIFSEKEFDKTLLNVNISNNCQKSDKLYGTPCSSGVVEGEIVIVEDPKNTMDIEGKILVTKMTDPGWVFLLTMAKGIISEKGSLLSHTAIISRELKVPSIVRCKKYY